MLGSSLSDADPDRPCGSHMHQSKISTIRQRRRRALEAFGLVALVAAAAFSGSMVKRSVSAPPAAQLDRFVAEPVVAMPDANATPTTERPIPSVVATGELMPPADANPARPAVRDDSDLADLPEGWRERITKLRDRGVIAGEIRVERLEPQPGNVRYFDGRPVRPARRLWMTVTAYSPDERSCGIWADGITASNKSVWTNAMQLVAADTRILPFGTLLSMDEYADGEIVPVLDRGGAIKGMRLDVLYATHVEALQFGVKRVPVTVWEYTDE